MIQSDTWKAFNNSLRSSTQGKWKPSLGRTDDRIRDQGLGISIVASESGTVERVGGNGSEIRFSKEHIDEASKVFSDFGSKVADQLQKHTSGADFAGLVSEVGRFKISCMGRDNLTASQQTNAAGEQEETYFLDAKLIVPEGVFLIS